MIPAPAAVAAAAEDAATDSGGGMGNRYCGACRGERGCRDCTAAVRAAKYAGLTEFSAEGLFQGDVPQEAAAPGGTASEHSFGMPEALLLAADIGTTTLGFVCADEQGKVLASYGVENPQRQTAADVIGRIDAACRGAGTQLKKQIREALAEGFLFVLKRAESLFAEPGAAWERLPVRIALAGNTTMQHLLLGYPLDGMARAPFCPYSVGEVHVSFASLFSETAAYAGLPDTVKEAGVFVFPCLSAFVGGDVLAGAYALSFPGVAGGVGKENGSYLLADLGTNGELLLSVSGNVYATAAAMGSAFEGGRFAYAVDLFRLMADALREGAADETGLFCEPYFTEGFSGLYQEDVRTFQLAKGAVRAGIEVLSRYAGIDAGQITTVFLAGGAGRYCRTGDLLRTGFMPEEFRGKVRVVGNSCIGGLLRYLSSPGERLHCAGEVINLAERPEFEELYYRWMEFPDSVPEKT